MNITIPTNSEFVSLNVESPESAAAVGDSASSERPTWRQRLAATALSVFGFVTFYLLSAGPVAGIHNVMEVGGFQKAVEVIYKPVVLLAKSHFEPFSSIIRWYIGLFR